MLRSKSKSQFPSTKEDVDSGGEEEAEDASESQPESAEDRESGAKQATRCLPWTVSSSSSSFDSGVGEDYIPAKINHRSFHRSNAT